MALDAATLELTARELKTVLADAKIAKLFEPTRDELVITLRTRQKRPWYIADEAVFFRAVRASFAMRRKKLSNGLSSGFPELGKAGAEAVIAAAGFDANVRGETLGIPEFARIANEIVRRKEKMRP